MNLWVPERQITKPIKSPIKLNIELKRQNSQANRSIMFYKDGDTKKKKIERHMYKCLEL